MPDLDPNPELTSDAPVDAVADAQAPDSATGPEIQSQFQNQPNANQPATEPPASAPDTSRSAFNLPSSDELPAAAEKLHDALERNGQAAVALFGRTLDLIGQQNRALEALDRQLSELAGQLKSLKNQ